MNAKLMAFGLLLVLAFATAAQAKIVEYEEGSAAAATQVIVPLTLDEAELLAGGRIPAGEY